MTNLTDTAEWTSVPLIDTSDYVLGGSGGIDNNPHQALANRTAYLKAQIEALQTTAAILATLIPTGVPLPFAGSVLPSGFLFCNGVAVSRTTYANLFAVIGTTYGSGDGTTTFNLPNMQRRFPLGKSSSLLLGATGGEETHVLNLTEIPAHDHHNGDYDRLMKMDGNSTTTGTNLDASNALGNEPNLAYSAGIQSAGGGAAHNNMPPYLVMNWIIKT